jgi:hypothetical protein
LREFNQAQEVRAQKKSRKSENSATPAKAGVKDF